MPIASLETYDISEARGFLCSYDATAVELSGDWAIAQKVAMSLPQMMTTGRVRELLRQDLPLLTEEDVEGLSETQARAAMVHYSFMVQALSGAKLRPLRFCQNVWRVQCVPWRISLVSNHFSLIADMF